MSFFKNMAIKPLRVLFSILLAVSAASFSPAIFAEGEAGMISLRSQGHFFVGADVSEPDENGSVTVKNQMYVGFQLVAEPKHSYPLILVHGGGGQASDWFSTPDGRDGWLDYFLAAGFDVYWVDRPGFGRSPTNTAYGELPPGAGSGIISFLATSDHWPGDSSDLTDPSVINWLSGSMPGPYAGNEVAATDLSELLERVGPAIVVTHSAGGMTGWWANDKSPELVKGIMAIEAVGTYILEEPVRNGLTFSPPLSADFKTVADSEGCGLQAANSVSTVPSLMNKPIFVVGADKGLIAPLPCGVKALKQAGADATYIYLPDYGFVGNGHFMTADTNNGEIAAAMIELLSQIQ